VGLDNDSLAGKRAEMSLCTMQVRSAKLGSLPLTSLSLLHQQGQAAEEHPTVLAGSYDNQVQHCKSSARSIQVQLLMNGARFHDMHHNCCFMMCKRGLHIPSSLSRHALDLMLLIKGVLLH